MSKRLLAILPRGLRHLCADFPEIAQCEGSGNRLVHLLCFVSDGFRMMPVPEAPLSLGHLVATWNEDRHPMVTWVVARN